MQPSVGNNNGLLLLVLLLMLQNAFNWRKALALPDVIKIG